MRLFGGNNTFKIPQQIDEPMAPLDLLYWAIFACLKSHAKDIDPTIELEAGMFIADNKLTIVVPHSCADVALKAAMGCYILKLFKGNLTWAVEINDNKYAELKAKSV